MVRPKSHCKIKFSPKHLFFNPGECPKRQDPLSLVELSPEEVEALRLRNIKELDQTKAAEEMEISQSTYQRILSGANKKITEAIIKGKAIKIISKK